MLGGPTRYLNIESNHDYYWKSEGSDHELVGTVILTATVVDLTKPLQHKTEPNEFVARLTGTSLQNLAMKISLNRVDEARVCVLWATLMRVGIRNLLPPQQT